MSRKAVWFGAGLVTLALWGVGLSLALTGHSRILLTAHNAVNLAKDATSKVRRQQHRILGDREMPAPARDEPKDSE